MRRTLSMRTAALGIAGALALPLGFASSAQALTWPKSGRWDCDVFWVNWSGSSSTNLSIEPHLARAGRAAMARYYGSKVVYYYGPWVTQGVSGGHKTSPVHASNGTWVGNYWQDDGGWYHLLYNGGSTHQLCTASPG